MIKHLGEPCSQCASLVYDFLPELDHHRIAFVTLKYLLSTEPEQVCADFAQWIKDVQNHSPVKVVICGQAEGLVPASKQFVHTLINQIKINCNDIVYVTSAVGSKQNVQEFHKYLGHPIKLLFYSNWQHTVVTHNSNITDWILKSRVDQVAEKKFLCYNGGPRPHRLALLYYLDQKDFIDQGLVSAHIPDSQNNQIFVHDSLEYTFPDIAQDASNSFVKKGLYPRVLDASYENIKQSTEGHSQCYVKTEHFEKTRFSIITETAYSNKHVCSTMIENNVPFVAPTIPCGFATEKTFKAMLGRHPFVMISTPGFLAQLRTLGYMTFHPYIDESYDRIVDDQERMLAVVAEITKLCDMDDVRWHAFQQHVEHIIEHNTRLLLNQNHNQYATKSWILTSDNQHVTIDRSLTQQTRRTHEKTLD